ncbi:hypothetical protein ACA910_005439 [Epithemia clementina (nom. ined.)]
MFVLMPLFFLGLPALFEEHTKVFKVLGSFIVVVLILALAYITFWCIYMNGREKCSNCMMERERKRVATKDLPDDMEYFKARVAALTEHTGLIVEDEEEVEEQEGEEHDAGDAEIEAPKDNADEQMVDAETIGICLPPLVFYFEIPTSTTA